jgi:hypothetical protein
MHSLLCYEAVTVIALYVAKRLQRFEHFQRILVCARLGVRC